MKFCRMMVNSIQEHSAITYGEVEAKATAKGWRTMANSFIPGLDKPTIRCQIIVYSKTKDRKKLDRLCRRIREAIDDYNGGSDET
jgi:hypothetical protein